LRAAILFELKLHQGIGIFATGTHNTARPMIAGTASDQSYAVGEQGRSQSIAGITLIITTIEAECERFSAIDSSTRIQTIAAHKFPRRLTSIMKVVPVSFKMPVTLDITKR
jgi:hypothetical protein